MAVLTNGHPLLLRGAVDVIEEHGDLQVVAEGDEAEQAAAQILDHAPEVAIVEIGVNPLKWIALLRQLAREGASTKIIVFYPSDAPESVTGSLAAGVSGFVSSHVNSEEFCRAIVAVANGGIFISQHLQAEMTRGD